MNIKEQFFKILIAIYIQTQIIQMISKNYKKIKRKFLKFKKMKIHKNNQIILNLVKLYTVNTKVMKEL